MEHLTHLARAMGDESSKLHVDVEQTRIKTTDHKMMLRATLSVPHRVMHAEASGMHFLEAADILEDKLRRQIEKYKERG